MDYENKHKEEIIRATQLWECGDITRENLEYIFPELKESEEEKIRKEIISALKFAYVKGEYDKHIAWLEKQGEYSSTVGKYFITPEESLGIDSDTFNKIVDELIYNELKPADKVEPKFHEGDWLCANELNDYANLIKIVKIVDVFGKKRYKISRDYDSDLDIAEFDFIEKHYHLWTIADAKDGDVLVSKHNQPFIYNGIFDEEYVGAYCSIDYLGNIFLEDIFSCNWSYKEGVKPTTKEQRDHLFEKMEEAGYKWDVEKKELKKIEDENYDGEDYGIDSLFHAQRILEKTLGKVDGYQTDDGILSHKCAITAVKKLYAQKPTEWSEEDERIRKALIDLIKSKEEDGYMVINNFSTGSILVWLEKQGKKSPFNEEIKEEQQ